jgi:D-proline reductase (dithiol) PrdB
MQAWRGLYRDPAHRPLPGSNISTFQRSNVLAVVISPVMAKTNELSIALRAFLKIYRWRTIDPVPLAVLPKPLPECRVALVSSAGFVVPGDTPFSDVVRGGDHSFRVIPAEADVQTLEEHHRSDSFSHAGIEEDRNMGLPLDRLHELAADGIIGEVAPRHISLMGSITAPGRFVQRTLPEVAEVLLEDQVNAALMVPV